MKKNQRMSSYNFTYMVLLVGLLVLVAGCTGGGRDVTVGSDRGITINEFTTSPSITEAITGDIVLFDLEVENIGGTTASNVQADLYGVEGQWRDTSGNLITDTQTKNLGTLSPPEPERNIPGDFKIAQWQLMTPAIPEGITPSLGVEARVTYNYNTSGHLDVSVVSEDEYRRLQILGQAVEDPVMINSNGPIKMSIPTQYSSIIIPTESSDATYTHPFRIDLQNLGDGFPVTEEQGGGIVGAGGRLTGTIQLFGPGVEFDDCLGVSGGNTINLDDAGIVVRLRDSGTVPIACSISFDKSEWAGRPSDKISFVFNLFYKYYVTKDVKISVIGK